MAVLLGVEEDVDCAKAAALHAVGSISKNRMGAAKALGSAMCHQKTATGRKKNPATMGF
jgi:hypothetical protein